MTTDAEPSACTTARRVLSSMQQQRIAWQREQQIRDRRLADIDRTITRCKEVIQRFDLKRKDVA
jgi:hypothetical protein